MNEENNGTPKNKWSRIFRKKWFFPALYLAIAALLLSAVVWYQNLVAPDEAQDEPAEDYTPVEHDEEAKPVTDQQQIIKPPVDSMDDAEIVTKYYDYSADQSEQEDAIIVFNDRYYQSTGIDVAADDGKTFDVVASLDGTVDEVKEDPLLGNVVTMKHDDGVTSHYASLGDVEVSADDEIKQGEVIGNAGENLFGKDNGTHLHFEIRKDGQDMNPEDFFNQPLSALDKALAEEDEADNDSKASEEANDSEGSDDPEGSDDSESADDSEKSDDEEMDSSETEVGPPLDNSEENDPASDENADETEDDDADKDNADKNDETSKNDDSADEKSA